MENLQINIDTTLDYVGTSYSFKTNGRCYSIQDTSTSDMNWEHKFIYTSAKEGASRISNSKEVWTLKELASKSKVYAQFVKQLAAFVMPTHAAVCQIAN